jgi:hypothetical protein
LHLPLFFELEETRKPIVVVPLVHVQTYLEGSGFLEDVLVVALELPAK